MMAPYKNENVILLQPLEEVSMISNRDIDAVCSLLTIVQKDITCVHVTVGVGQTSVVSVSSLQVGLLGMSRFNLCFSVPG